MDTKTYPLPGCGDDCIGCRIAAARQSLDALSDAISAADLQRQAVEADRRQEAMIDKILCADCLLAYLGAPASSDTVELIATMAEGAVTIFEGAAVCLSHFSARHGVA